MWFLIGTVGRAVLMLNGMRCHMSVAHIRRRVDVLVGSREEGGEYGENRNENPAAAKQHQTILQVPVAAVKPVDRDTIR